MFNICSTYKNFRAELEIARKLFPLKRISSVHFRLDCAIFPQQFFVIKSSVMIAPFLTGPHSLQILSQITGLCYTVFPHLNLRFVFKSTKRLYLFHVQRKRSQFSEIEFCLFLQCPCCTASSFVLSFVWVKPRVIITPENPGSLGISPLRGKLWKSRSLSSISAPLHSTKHTASFTSSKFLLPALIPMMVSFTKAYLSLNSNLTSKLKAVLTLFNFSN